MRKRYEKKGTFQEIGFSLFLCPVISNYFTDNYHYCPDIHLTTITRFYSSHNPYLFRDDISVALIYFITRITESSTDIQEYARISTTWAMFIVFGASFCAILIWMPDTILDLYRMPFAFALCIGMQYYSPVLNQLSELKNIPEKDMKGQNEAVINITPEKSYEKHEETIIELTTEAWYLAKTFEHAILQLNIDQPRRYTSRIEWFLKKAEESLNDVGLRIVNVEGHAYDAGMAADPVDPPRNIDVNDSLEVTWMIEPIIMKGTDLIKRGKVYIRRTES